VAVIKAEQHQEVQVIQADAFKEQAEKRAQKLAEDLMAEAKAYSEAKMIRVTAQKLNLQTQALARLNVSKLRAQGLMLEADAEGN